jgi:hypothetical protein
LVETLTESFCERCGTRYEFKAPTRLNPLRKTRGLFGGLKNYLTSQDDFGDAMGDAMRTEEEQLASAQLEAFHESFNFCINCRQYTCVNCWNDDAGRCRSCAPIPGTDDLAERLAASLAGNGAGAIAPPVEIPADGGLVQPTMAEADPQGGLGLEPWPSSDIVEPPPGTNGHAPADWPSADDLAPAASFDAGWDPEPVISEVEPESEPEPEPTLADVEPEHAMPEFEAEPEPALAEVEPEPWVAETAPEPILADFEPAPVVPQGEPAESAWEPALAEAELQPADVEPTWEPAVAETDPTWEPAVAETVEEPEPEPRPLRVLAWDEDAAYDVAGPMVAEPEPEPMVAEAEPEPMVAEAEPEPMVAEVEPQPQLPSAPRIAPISETILRFPSRPAPEPPSEQPVAAESDTPELAARRAQLDMLGLGDTGQGALEPDGRSVLPYRSRGATPTPIELAALRASGGFWEASAREVAGAAANVGVQNCGQCGLSLSATARFCRRCGTRQAQPA